MPTEKVYILAAYVAYIHCIQEFYTFSLTSFPIRYRRPSSGQGKRSRHYKELMLGKYRDHTQPVSNLCFRHKGGRKPWWLGAGQALMYSYIRDGVQCGAWVDIAHLLVHVYWLSNGSYE